MKKIIVMIALIMISGCAGMGFDKKLTLMPDEVWLVGDFNPQKNFNSDEITGGLKWKLR